MPLSSCVWLAWPSLGPEFILDIPRRGMTKDAPLLSIEGTVPSNIAPPPGCRFADRCGACRDRCRTEAPLLRAIGPAHDLACHFPWEVLP